MANQDIDDGNDADYPPYLCFQALESDFRVCLGGDFHEHVCQYSFNRKDWFNLLARTYTPAIGILQKVYFRANLDPVLTDATSNSGIKSIGKFSTTKKYRLSGNPTSMLHGMDWTLDNFDTSVPSSYGLAFLFQSSKAVSISKDFFNFKADSFRTCYQMFYNSNYLKESIVINNIGTLGNGIFNSAFQYCPIDEITIANKSLANQAFVSAFLATNIKKISLPATYIYASAYSSICKGCGSLVEVFINGRNLEVSTIAGYTQHLNEAFYGCKNLSKVTYLVTYPFTKKYTNNWLTGVAEEGTIILSKNITWNPDDYRNGNTDNIEGSDTFDDTITWGIPKNWIVQYYDPITHEIKENRDEFKVFGDYMILECIKTNSKQYIDSQIKLNINSRIEVDASPTTSTATNDYALCGNSYDTKNRITINPANKNTAISKFGEKSYTGNLYRPGRHTWAADKNGLYIDGEKVGEWGGDVTDFEHTTSFYILADRTSTGVQSKALTGTRIYGLKVYENGELVANMVPALSVSQKRPGLYDITNDRFLVNIGEGEFTYE